VVGTQLQFYPYPDQSYTALLTYYQMLPPLAANGANWLLAFAPDAYLYGALTQASPLSEGRRPHPRLGRTLHHGAERPESRRPRVQSPA